MNKILMTIGSEKIEVELLNTPTAEAMKQSLPFASKAQTWGDEVQ